MDHPTVARALRTGYHTPPIRNPKEVTNACECGVYEAEAEWKGQKLCADCLEGIVGVRLLWWTK
jgi:hypothetical protein